MTTTAILIDRLLNEKEVAEILGVSISTVRRRRLLGLPPIATKIGSLVRYKPVNVTEFVDECPTIGEPKEANGHSRELLVAESTEPEAEASPCQCQSPFKRQKTEVRRS